MYRTLLAVIATIGVAGAALSMALLSAEAEDSLTPRAYIADLAKPPQPPKPTPIPTATPYAGPIASIYLGSASIFGADPVGEADTHFVNGRELLQDPRYPAEIVWYPRFGRPGWGGGNTIFAAHVNYVGHGNGPFAYLTSAQAGDALYVTMGNGTRYTYVVRTVEIWHLADLDMDLVVYPGLSSNTERITLISCGGTFIPAAVGGEYDSRVILVAERSVD
ncbi:MAG: class F sortase [Dehalococcoidia bacterium]